ncbi:MAG: cytochrome c maturation protein CcmE [Betaproteobacteria bacterium]
MKPRYKRLLMIITGICIITIATVLILNALNTNIALYISPTEVVQGKAPNNHTFRIGGLVKSGSLIRKDLSVYFVMTDLKSEVPVSYKGILPDLFKEGKGAVVQGKLESNGNFIASDVLAKHDENYMPPEAKHALDAAQKEVEQ